MSEDKYRLQQCFHCGNMGLMEVLCQNNYEYGGPVFDQMGEAVDFELVERFEWTLFSCPVCHKLTLKESYCDESTGFHFSENEILYPTSSINYEGVPKTVKSAFEAALKVKNIDTEICLLSLRRTLEAICKERGAKGHTLEAMINDLFTRNILPGGMDDACWIIRQLGNGAAHADGQKVYLHEVNQTIGFLETIIKYLYTLPLQMDRLKNKIAPTKQKEDKPDADA